MSEFVKTNDFYYKNRDKLKAGMKFLTWSGDRVMLERRVPGDGTQWYVSTWSDYCKTWIDDDMTIEPGDLKVTVG